MILVLWIATRWHSYLYLYLNSLMHSIYTSFSCIFIINWFNVCAGPRVWHSPSIQGSRGRHWRCSFRYYEWSGGFLRIPDIWRRSYPLQKCMLLFELQQILIIMQYINLFFSLRCTTLHCSIRYICCFFFFVCCLCSALYFILHLCTVWIIILSRVAEEPFLKSPSNWVLGFSWVSGFIGFLRAKAPTAFSAS